MAEHSARVDDGTESEQKLRRWAEAVVKATGRRRAAGISGEQVGSLLHELQVHRVELEAQNEELRRAQVGLDAARERYFELYDMAPIGYLTVSERGLVLESNLRASSLLDVPRSALAGQRLSRFVSQGDQGDFTRHRRQALATNSPQVCELNMLRADGAEFVGRLESTAVTADDGAARSCRVTLSDITPQRSLQASLAQVDHVTRMGVLAASVAHEINNPLTYVLYNAETAVDDVAALTAVATRLRDALRERVGEDELAAIAGDGVEVLDATELAALQDRVAQILMGTRRIVEITRNLSRISQHARVERSNVDLNRAAEQAVRMARQEIESRAVLVKDLGPLPLVEASEGRLSQVLLNLLVNAARSFRKGPVANNRVSVRTWAEGGTVFAEVADTGCGISKEHRLRIFEPFFSTRAAGEGTGLGLALAHRAISDFGGKILVESEVDRGTRFVISLPAQTLTVSEPPAPEATEAPVARARILIVDDEALVRASLQGILSRAHEVVLADSGRAAQRLLARDAAFDLVLCDVMMPDVSGITLHAWLAERHPVLGRRLVFMTGGVFTPEARSYFREVPNPQLEKPFDARRLLRQVNEFLSASQGDLRRPSGP